MKLVLGIGNELRSDDAIGNIVVSELKSESKRAVFAPCGSAPENVVGKFAGKKIDFLVVVDAADFAGEPGETRFISPEELDKVSLSTHKLALDLILSLLKPKRLAILGVKIADGGVGEGLSPALLAKKPEIKQKILQALSQPQGI